MAVTHNEPVDWTDVLDFNPVDAVLPSFLRSGSFR